jgi:hypothetical protein
MFIFILKAPVFCKWLRILSWIWRFYFSVAYRRSFNATSTWGSPPEGCYRRRHQLPRLKVLRVLR